MLAIIAVAMAGVTPETWVGSATTTFYTSSNCAGSAQYVSPLSSADFMPDGCFCFKGGSGVGAFVAKQCYICGESGGLYTQQANCNSDCSSCSGDITRLDVHSRISDGGCVAFTSSVQTGAWIFRVLSTSSGKWPGLCPESPAETGRIWQGSAELAAYTPSDCSPLQSPASTTTITRQEVLGNGCSCIQTSAGANKLECLTCGRSASHVMAHAGCNADCSACSGALSFTDHSIPWQKGSCVVEKPRNANGNALTTRSVMLSTLTTTSVDQMLLCDMHKTTINGSKVSLWGLDSTVTFGPNEECRLEFRPGPPHRLVSNCQIDSEASS